MISYWDLKEYSILRGDSNSKSRDSSLKSVISYLNRKRFSVDLFFELVLLNPTKLHKLCQSLPQADRQLFHVSFPESPVSDFKFLYIELLLFVHARQGSLYVCNSDANECRCCFTPYSKERQIRILVPCRHILCNFCLPLLTKSQCPFCREGFRSALLHYPRMD
jgi:hypothetical protein